MIRSELQRSSVQIRSEGPTVDRRLPAIVSSSKPRTPFRARPRGPFLDRGVCPGIFNIIGQAVVAVGQHGITTSLCPTSICPSIMQPHASPYAETPPRKYTHRRGTSPLWRFFHAHRILNPGNRAGSDTVTLTHTLTVGVCWVHVPRFRKDQRTSAYDLVRGGMVV